MTQLHGKVTELCSFYQKTEFKYLTNDQVKNDGGRIDEQIDENTGAQISAESLTWSYANILHALFVRKNVVKLQTEVLGF